MLNKTVLIPSFLSPVHNLVCANGITILKELYENGIILVDNKDNKRIIMGCLLNTINSWPDKFRKRGFKLLGQLDKKNRFVKSKQEYNLSEICSNEPCQHCVGIAQVSNPRIVFAPSECSVCAKEQLSDSIEITNIEDYQTTQYYENRETENHINNSDHIENILKPIFEYAKNIHIIDRSWWIHLWDRRKKRIKISLIENINRWLSIVHNSINNSNKIDFNIHVRIPKIKNDGNFEVDEHIHELMKDKIKEIINIQFIEKINLVFRFYDLSRQNNHLSHKRYLITDQITIELDFGIDDIYRQNEDIALKIIENKNENNIYKSNPIDEIRF